MKQGELVIVLYISLNILFTMKMKTINILVSALPVCTVTEINILKN